MCQVYGHKFSFKILLDRIRNKPVVIKQHMINIALTGKSPLL